VSIQFRQRLAHVLLVGLLLGAIGDNLHHGLAIGQDHQLFAPIYRVRQTLAVAISRLHEPPARGYLAFRSVVDILNARGFAIFPEDRGPEPTPETWRATLTNGAALDRTISEAVAAQVNPALPPELIRGNELGYADFIYWAFRLFGPRTAALFYFYFLILGTSCALFVWEFRRSPFLLYLLLVYLAGIHFLMDYAVTGGLQLNTVANSRLFSALSLPAAAHVFFVLWRGARAPPATVAVVALQITIFAILVSCRYEAIWQAMVVVAAAALLEVAANGNRWIALAWQWPGAIEFRSGRWSVGSIAAFLVVVGAVLFSSGSFSDSGIWATPFLFLIMATFGFAAALLLTPNRIRWDAPAIGTIWRQWPAVLLILALLASRSSIDLTADQTYAGEPKNHVFWHEVLVGILSSSPGLDREYLGTDKIDLYSDSIVYDAVLRDLNQRRDLSSPIASENQGKIMISLWGGWEYYDQLVRSLTLRIVVAHPLQVLRGLWTKARHQFASYSCACSLVLISSSRPAFVWSNLKVPLGVIAIGTALCLMAGGIVGGWAVAREGAAVLILFLTFASLTPAIEPSPLSVGSLLCYLAACAIVATWGTATLFGRLWALVESLSKRMSSVARK
jgi:hypothetical protein